MYACEQEHMKEFFILDDEADVRETLRIILGAGGLRRRLFRR